MCKLYAAQFHQRFSKAVDPYLELRHFELRASQSFSAPLFLLRGFTEGRDMSPAYFFILFHGLSQAFTSVGHPHLQAALLWYEFAPAFTAALAARYSSCSFLFLTSRKIPGLSGKAYFFIIAFLAADISLIFSTLFMYTLWVNDIEHVVLHSLALRPRRSP